MLTGCVDWPEDLARKYVEKGYWEGITLAELLDRTVARYPEKEAVSGEGIHLTYQELQKYSQRLSLHFLEQGLRPSDRVIFHLPNIPEFLMAFFGLVRIGVIPIMHLPPHRQTELLGAARLAEAKAYFMVGAGPAARFDFGILAEELLKGAPSLKQVYVAGPKNREDWLSLTDLINDPIEERVSVETLQSYKPSSREVALFQLSGGTTGLPKICPRIHDDYYYNARVSAERSFFTEDTVFLMSVPMAHNGPMLQGVLATFYVGGRLVLSTQTSAESLLEHIQKERAYSSFIVPAQVVGCLQMPNLKDYDLSSMECLVVAGSRLEPVIAERFREATGVIPHQFFGMAEGVCMGLEPTAPAEEFYLSCGYPFCEDDELKLVDEEDNEVPRGEVGEMLCQGPYTIRGYYKSPEINAATFTTDGFYRSGDLMRLNAMGNYVVEGRKKDLINRGGEKISAEEIEDILLRHPRVLNAAAVPMPDEMMGEKTCAYVVLKAGTLNLAEVQDLMEKANIAKFKWPERLEVVEAFPLTPFGKVNKQALKKVIAEKIQQEKG